ncbi:MAG: Cell envelope-related transcriptional attenuator [Modestobacter sp.]|nr:Cell envelope-related transcriptional attenuator [Modestobacter sp.]
MLRTSRQATRGSGGELHRSTSLSRPARGGVHTAVVPPWRAGCWGVAQSLDPGRQWLGWNLARVAESSVTRTDAFPSSGNSDAKGSQHAGAEMNLLLVSMDSGRPDAAQQA